MLDSRRMVIWIAALRTIGLAFKWANQISPLPQIRGSNLKSTNKKAKEPIGSFAI